MRNNNRAFPLLFLRGLGCLAAALALGFLGMAAAVFIRGALNGEAMAIPDALQAAAQGGMLPFLTGGLRDGWRQALTRSLPTALTALSAAVAWQAGLYNLGAAGQYGLGMAAAMACAGLGLPWYACLAASALAGAACGAVPGLMKARFQVHEALSGLLATVMCLYGGQALAQSFSWEEAAFPPLGLPALIVWAALLALCWLWLRFTVSGFESRVMGRSRAVARYAGMNTKKNTVLSLSLAGLLSGVGGGMAFALGTARSAPGLSLALAGAGPQGIAAAVLGAGDLAGASLFGLALGYLAQGAQALDASPLPPETGEMALAFALYLGAFMMGERRRGQ